MVAMADDSLDSLTKLALAFRDERNWAQFHTPKDLASNLCVESAELMQIFLWRTGPALEAHIAAKKQDIADELADVLHSVLLLADAQGIDLAAAFREKMVRNAEKYPVAKAHGQPTKYTEL